MYVHIAYEDAVSMETHSIKSNLIYVISTMDFLYQSNLLSFIVVCGRDPLWRLVSCAPKAVFPNGKLPRL